MDLAHEEPQNIDWDAIDEDIAQLADVLWHYSAAARAWSIRDERAEHKRIGPKLNADIERRASAVYHATHADGYQRFMRIRRAIRALRATRTEP